MNWCKRMLDACQPPLTRQQKKAFWHETKRLEFHEGPLTPGLKFVVLPLATLFFLSPCFCVSNSGAFSMMAWLGTTIPVFAYCGINLYRANLKKRRILGGLLYRAGYRVSLCGNCGYDLHAITSNACPECGEPIAEASHETRDGFSARPAAVDRPRR